MTDTLISLSSSLSALVFVKSSALLATVLLIGFALRRRSASSRHFVWTLSFAALLALPVLVYASKASSSWRIDVPVHVEQDMQAPIVVAVHDQDSAMRSTTPRPAAAPRARTNARQGHVWWKIVWALGGLLFLCRLAFGWLAGLRATHARAR